MRFLSAPPGLMIPLTAPSALHCDFQILPASWRDLGAVRRLEQICFPQDAWPLLDILSVLTFPNLIRLKAVCEDRLIGFVAADVRRHERLTWIATIGVLPEYRRQGVGRALMEACEALIPTPYIRLSVRASNQPAIRLYESMGYVPVGRWKAYYRDGEDALVMEKAC